MGGEIGGKVEENGIKLRKNLEKSRKSGGNDRKNLWASGGNKM